MLPKQRLFSAPTSVNVEITNACNSRCRHCYNGPQGDTSMGRNRLARLVEMLGDAGVFHVVFSGGEPLLFPDLLEYGISLAVEKGLSVSCNSNLTLATKENMSRLRAAGLDHILTSMASCDPTISEFIMCRKGMHSKIVRGIRIAIANGLRVSVNTVVSRWNKDQVYDTACFASRLGCQRIFATRLVPPPGWQVEFDVGRRGAIKTLDQLIAAKRETGIEVGCLVNYPLCLFADPKIYRDFVGRGCPAQRGHRMSIGVNGESHACVHEVMNYGNVFETGIEAAYLNMREWHTGQFQFEGCSECGLAGVCRSGCRMSAMSAFGRKDGKDPLMRSVPEGREHDLAFLRPPPVDQDSRFVVPKHIRFREEDGFYLVNLRWADTIVVDSEIAKRLRKAQSTGACFGLEDVDEDGLAWLASRGVIKDSGARSAPGARTGLGFDASDLR